MAAEDAFLVGFAADRHFVRVGHRAVGTLGRPPVARLLLPLVPPLFSARRFLLGSISPVQPFLQTVLARSNQPWPPPGPRAQTASHGPNGSFARAANGRSIRSHLPRLPPPAIASAVIPSCCIGQ